MVINNNIIWDKSMHGRRLHKGCKRQGYPLTITKLTGRIRCTACNVMLEPKEVIIENGNKTNNLHGIAGDLLFSDNICGVGNNKEARERFAGLPARKYDYAGGQWNGEM